MMCGKLVGKEHAHALHVAILVEVALPTLAIEAAHD